ncbi:hypothetical protein Lal_00041092 [Lupinus albus]|nr:hypothetical protein Lal_00041092 [Lupinus albus]
MKILAGATLSSSSIYFHFFPSLQNGTNGEVVIGTISVVWEEMFLMLLGVVLTNREITGQKVQLKFYELPENTTWVIYEKHLNTIGDQLFWLIFFEDSVAQQQLATKKALEDICYYFSHGQIIIF